MSPAYALHANVPYGSKVTTYSSGPPGSYFLGPPGNQFLGPPGRSLQINENAIQINKNTLPQVTARPFKLYRKGVLPVAPNAKKPGVRMSRSLCKHSLIVLRSWTCGVKVPTITPLSAHACVLFGSCRAASMSFLVALHRFLYNGPPMTGSSGELVFHVCVLRLVLNSTFWKEYTTYASLGPHLDDKCCNNVE